MAKRRFWLMYAVLVVAAVMIIVPGCEETGITAAEVVTAVEEGADELKSCRFDMTMKEFLLMPETSIAGVIDKENKRMKLEPEVTELGTQMRTAMYVLDNIMYTMTDAEGESEWMKMALPPEGDDLWDTDNPVGDQLSLFEQSLEWNRAGDGKVKGIDCYVVEVVPALDLLWDTLDMGEGYVEDQITGMSMRFWFAKDTFFIVKMHLSMRIEVVGADLEYEIVFYDHNKPVSIELPPEAESAVWIDGGSGKVIITIGELTDLNGPSSSALITLHYALDDMVRYFNEEGLIPEVEISIASYNTMSDPARDVPGYEWVKERGAEVIITPLASTAELLKPFAERDKMPVLSLSGSAPQIDPPGWVFCINSPISYQVKTLLKWISEAGWDWETMGPAKIGSVGWNFFLYDMEIEGAVREYCQHHPDKFEYVGGYLAPVGTVVWAGGAEQLKDCDYVFMPSNGMTAGTFAKDYRDREYTARFIGTEALSAYRGSLMNTVVWETLDGMVTAQSTRWWNEHYPIVDLAEQLLYQYHPWEAEDVIDAGVGYVGGIQQFYFALDLLRQAIEEVGLENFDGQAFYDTAIGFQETYEGLPERGFTPTKRYATDHVAMYEWRTAAEDLVRISDWLPVLLE